MASRWEETTARFGSPAWPPNDSRRSSGATGSVPPSAGLVTRSTRCATAAEESCGADPRCGDDVYLMKDPILGWCSEMGTVVKLYGLSNLLLFEINEDVKGHYRKREDIGKNLVKECKLFGQVMVCRVGRFGPQVRALVRFDTADGAKACRHAMHSRVVSVGTVGAELLETVASPARFTILEKLMFSPVAGGAVEAHAFLGSAPAN